MNIAILMILIIHVAFTVATDDRVWWARKSLWIDGRVWVNSDENFEPEPPVIWDGLSKHSILSLVIISVEVFVWAFLITYDFNNFKECFV